MNIVILGQLQKKLQWFIVKTPRTQLYLFTQNTLRKTCTRMFIVVLVIMAQCRDPRCQAIREWISKLLSSSNGIILNNEVEELTDMCMHQFG